MLSVIRMSLIGMVLAFVLGVFPATGSAADLPVV
jgi:hypothetical protein